MQAACTGWQAGGALPCLPAGCRRILSLAEQLITPDWPAQSLFPALAHPLPPPPHPSIRNRVPCHPGLTELGDLSLGGAGPGPLPAPPIPSVVDRHVALSYGSCMQLSRRSGKRVWGNRAPFHMAPAPSHHSEWVLCGRGLCSLLPLPPLVPGLGNSCSQEPQLRAAQLSGVLGG